MLQIAGYQVLAGGFKSLLLRLIPGVLVAAIAMTTFAWASNPPDPTPPSVSLDSTDLSDADLRNAQLQNANLDGANLQNADLSGANLTDASLRDVTWAGATCPDGTLGNNNGTPATCLGHLSP